MSERTALITAEQTPDGIRYLPANKNAVAVGAIFSSWVLDASRMGAVRSHGYTPRLTNGEEIARVDVRA